PWASACRPSAGPTWCCWSAVACRFTTSGRSTPANRPARFDRDALFGICTRPKPPLPWAGVGTHLPLSPGSASVAPVSSFENRVMATRTKAPLDFEQSLAELQQLVERLEGGELSLEESLNAFEQGIRLTRDCQSALSQAEQKVQMLLERDGETRTEPFQVDDQP